MSGGIVSATDGPDGNYDMWVTKDTLTGEVTQIAQCWSNYESFTWEVDNYHRDGTTSSYRSKQTPCPKCQGPIHIYEHDSVLGPHTDKRRCQEAGCPSI